MRVAMWNAPGPPFASICSLSPVPAALRCASIPLRAAAAQVDRALQLLPSSKLKLYRGINVRFSEDEYKAGHQICWPAFSSASAEQSVAEDFVAGDEGSLFIIQVRGMHTPPPPKGMHWKGRDLRGG